MPSLARTHGQTNFGACKASAFYVIKRGPSSFHRYVKNRPWPHRVPPQCGAACLMLLVSAGQICFKQNTFQAWIHSAFMSKIFKGFLVIYLRIGALSQSIITLALPHHGWTQGGILILLLF